MTELLTPTHIQETGLSMVITDPLISTSRGAYHINTKIISYGHQKLADGGDWSASITMLVPLEEVEEWFEKGIGRHVEIYNQSLIRRFSGFVNNITIQAGGVSVSRGPMMDIGNKVIVSYAPVSYDEYPPSVGATTQTTAANDIVSQGMYGIIKKFLSGGNCTDIEAELVRDTYLAENSYPSTSGSLSLTPGSGESGVTTLDILGYVHFLKMYAYNTTVAGIIDISVKIINALTANPNAVLDTSYSKISSNTQDVGNAEDRDRMAYDVIKIGRAHV